MSTSSCYHTSEGLCSIPALSPMGLQAVGPRRRSETPQLVAAVAQQPRKCSSYPSSCPTQPCLSLFGADSRSCSITQSTSPTEFRLLINEPCQTHNMASLRKFLIHILFINDAYERGWRTIFCIPGCARSRAQGAGPDCFLVKDCLSTPQPMQHELKSTTNVMYVRFSPPSY